MEMRSHGACCIVVGGTIKRNYGDVIAAKKGRKLISTLQGFHVIEHKRSYLNNNKKYIISNEYMMKREKIVCNLKVTGSKRS